MKLKYERYKDVGCLYVRGTPNSFSARMIEVGIESLSKDLEEPLVINLLHSHFSKESIQSLSAWKKKFMAQFQAPSKEITIHFIHPDRSIGDFPSIEAYVTKRFGSRFRVISERIQLEDEIYLLGEKIADIEAKMKVHLADPEKSHQLILENESLKGQKQILSQMILHLRGILKIQTPHPKKQDKFDERMTAAIEGLKVQLGRNIDL